MQKAKAHVFSVLIFISVLLLLFFGGRAILLWQIDIAVTTRLHKLKLQGIEIDFSKMEVALWSKSLRFENVHLKFTPPQALASTTLTTPKLVIAGFSLMPFIAKKEIVIKTISLTRPEAIIYYAAPDSTHSIKEELPHFSIMVGDVVMDTLLVQYINKVNSTVLAKVNLNLAIKEFALFTTDSLNWTAELINLKAIAIELPSSFYKIKTKQITFSSSQKLLHLDSIEMTPTLSKLEFARKNIYQVDRITACIPVLLARGFEIGETFQLRLKASNIEFSFNLDVFHDKRFPMPKQKPFILPSAFMNQLGFPIQIDTVKINSSFISYDEFPIEGKKAGSIFFNNLKATLLNISTKKVGETRMKVDSRFMDAGNLIADFVFPLEKYKPYTVKGFLLDFSLPAINQMLTPLEYIKIETGNLRSMDFQFNYNEKKANGALVLDYSNLNVSLLKKKKPNEINVLASFVANSLLKDTMDKNILESKRTGAIEFERDPTEGIFGYWWKSLREGIKSVFTVKKIISRNHKKM